MVFLQTKVSTNSHKKALALALGVSVSSLTTASQAFSASPSSSDAASFLPKKKASSTTVDYLSSLSKQSDELQETIQTLSGSAAATKPTPSLVFNGVSVTPQAEECMRDTNRPLIRVLEHGLPDALQTHEMIYDAQSGNILTTQMEEGRLVKLHLDPATGVITSKVKSVLMQMHQSEINNKEQSSSEQEEDPFVGLHGLCASQMFPGRAWVTLQYVNRVCLVDIKTFEVQAVIECPRDLPDGNTVGGPHCITEGNGRLYICMKGGASCHGTTASREQAEEATAHGVYRVELDPQTGGAKAGGGTLFRVPPTPVMAVVDGQNNCWVVTDADGSLTLIPHDAKCSGCAVNVKLPYQYALYHQTGPGLQVGPDGNVWFTILNGEGLIGKVDINTLKVTVFEIMSSSWNPHPRIIHLSWDANNVLYAISSDLLDKTAVNSLIRIKFDKDYEQIIAQHELALPSQASCIHRIAHIDSVSEPSVLVTELTKSQLLQVFKSTLPPLSSFPTKTMRMEVRRVYDAFAPCPRTGNPVCLCEFNQDSIALPKEAQFEGQETFLDPDMLEQVGAQPYVNPRTGEESWLVQDNNVWAGEKWMEYPKTGFDASEHMIDLYARNGGTMRMSSTATTVGNTANHDGGNVLNYYPEKLKELLQREPGRIPLMTKELQAAGLTLEDVAPQPKMKDHLADSEEERPACPACEAEMKLKPGNDDSNNSAGGDESGLRP